MKTVTPKKAVSEKTDTSVASEAEQTSSNSVTDSSGNPMSVAGDKGGVEVHSESTAPGKMDFGFMEKETTETPMAVPVHAKGAYPIAENVKEGPNTVPTHAPGTYVPAEEADTKPKE